VTEPTFQAWSDDPEAEVADVTTADEGRKLHRRLEHELRQHWHSMPDEAISAYERALNSLRLEFKAAGNENRRNVQRAGEAHERTEARPRTAAARARGRAATAEAGPAASPGGPSMTPASPPPRATSAASGSRLSARSWACRCSCT
jgi:hypothetical protein